jgi:hypothetical protein
MASNDMIELLMGKYEELRKGHEQGGKVYRLSDTKISMPITKVNDVKCDVRIMISHQSVLLQICSEEVFNNAESCDYRILYSKLLATKPHSDKTPLSKEDFVSALVLIKKTLPILIMDRYSGKFIEKGEKKCAMHIMNDFLSGTDNIERNVDNCCVCMCDTMTQTACGHHICVVCWDSIKPVNDKENDFGEYTMIPCPMCRKDITYVDVDEE